MNFNDSPTPPPDWHATAHGDGKRRDVTGPAWFAGAVVGNCWIAPHRDGYHWRVERVEQGGRVIRWRCEEDNREATTEVTPEHPDYPSDAAVLAAARAAKAAAKAARV